MSFSAFEQKSIERSVQEFLDKRRPPPKVRTQLDLDFSIEKQSVQIFEVRPYWQDPTEKTKTPVAKITYVKSREFWILYWIRSDMKWHRYEPDDASAKFPNLDRALITINNDEFGCFWG